MQENYLGKNKQKKMREFFFVKAGRKYNKVMVRDILFAEGAENNVKLVTSSHVYVVKITMLNFVKQLPAELFCRVHKSWVVGLFNITSFDDEVVYIENTEIPIGKAFQKEFLKSVSIIPISHEA